MRPTRCGTTNPKLATVLAVLDDSGLRPVDLFADIELIGLCKHRLASKRDLSLAALRLMGHATAAAECLGHGAVHSARGVASR